MIPVDEQTRLRASDEIGFVDARSRGDFDRIAAVAARVFRAPVAFVSLVGRQGHYFGGRYGSEDAPDRVSAFLLALTSDALLVVADASKDERFASDPVVVDAPGIRFYAGAPLVSKSGHVVGTLSVVDFRPRSDLDGHDRQILRDLAQLAMDELEVHRPSRMGSGARLSHSQSDRQFEILVGGIKDYALYMLDPTGIVTSWNVGAQKIKGYAAEEIIGQHYSRFYTDADRRAGSPAHSLRVAAETGRFEDNAWRVRKDGSLFWANVIIDAIRDDDGLLIGFAKITRDITDRRKNEEHLKRLAHFDTLTGLANRYFFLTKLDEILERQPATILVLDLDGFKEINDTLGHQAGDFLLKVAADRIEDTIAGKGSAGRLGGDEFAAILPIADPIEVAHISKTIVDAFRIPFSWEGQEIRIGVSIGIAISPNHGNSADELLANGDLALYDAKARRQIGYSLFQDSFRQTILARRTCEQELVRAFDHGEFELYYQPQFRLADRRIVGAEALLRWNHPQRGRLSPAAFIHVLERCPLALQVGHWVVRTACAFAASLQGQREKGFCIAANLFGAQFRGGDLVPVVSSALAQHKLSPSCLELEITENIILQHDEAVIAALRELSQIGVRTSFDDYGTGYASLSLLKRFPLDRLKIDQSFVRAISTEPEDAAVVKAILYLAESFGLEVVAEGIEHEDQERLLREFGCQYGQGYLYARPMRATELRALLAKHESCDLDRRVTAGG